MARRRRCCSAYGHYLCGILIGKNVIIIIFAIVIMIVITLVIASVSSIVLVSL